MATLGSPFDVHTGGVDLIFPHHEDEIAQSEAATGREFVRTWLHCAHLQMAGTKMAKSTGNIARVADVLAGGVDPRALRYALISVNYRMPLNYSDESLAAAAAAVDRLDALVAALDAYDSDAGDDDGLDSVLSDARSRVAAALDDDLNVSAALGALFDLARELNRRIQARRLSTAGAGRALEALRDVDRIFAVLPEPRELDPELTALLDARVAARSARDWTESDRLRDELAARGIAVEDTRDGQRWRRAPAVVGG
jgi:cysteinyl-tRNA synthetase